jgi:hypothetical protein
LPECERRARAASVARAGPDAREGSTGASWIGELVSEHNWKRRTYPVDYGIDAITLRGR